MERLQHIEDFTLTITQGGFHVLSGVFDDGTPWTICRDVVYITLKDGREFYLPNGRVVWVDSDDAPFQGTKGEYVPGVMADKVVEKGVDLQHWIEVEKQAPLETVLADEWVREEEDRIFGGGW